MQQHERGLRVRCDQRLQVGRARTRQRDIRVAETCMELYCKGCKEQRTSKVDVVLGLRRREHTGLVVLGGYLESRAHNKVIQRFVCQPRGHVWLKVFVGIEQGCGLRSVIGNGGHIQSGAVTNNRLEPSHVRVFRARHQSRTQFLGETRQKHIRRGGASLCNVRDDVLK